jgi:ribosome biogenesis protein SSF1/2
MGKRKRRGRCVKNNTNVNIEPEETVEAPHSFVIHKGLPGGNLLELTKDFRKVMEPFTAISLKERKKNTIKDFVSVAGPLHVSHLSIFSRTEVGMYLKICKLPRGPTMTFKIHNFSLARDVVSSLKKQNVVEAAFKHSPLIVLNSFTAEGLHMKLMASMFQNMFPTINLTNVDLNTVRRCVLMNYNPSTNMIDFRHYTIKIIPVGISKGVKKVVQGKVPNLNRCNDISEFLTKSGMLSESEFEDDPSNQVTLPQKIISRGNVESGKSAIKLHELGPRLTLQLIKIEDGLLDGEVLYHNLIEKTDEEKLEIQKKRENKKKLKEKRKKIQAKNKEVKENLKQKLKEKSLEGMKKVNPQEKSSSEANEAKEPEDNDADYYREEVGEEPDEDLFSSSTANAKRPPKFVQFRRKRKWDDTNKSPVKRFKTDGVKNKNTNRKRK